MKNRFSVLRSKGAKVVAGVAALTASAVASAQTSAVGTAITAAQTEGESNVTLVVGGLIAIVAIGVGVNMVISMLRKA